MCVRVETLAISVLSGIDNVGEANMILYCCHDNDKVAKTHNLT